MSQRLTFDDIARLPAPGMDGPTGFAFSPDGTWLTFLHAADGSNVRSLWRQQVASGERHELLAPTADRAEGTLREHEVLRRERSRERGLGVTTYQVAETADRHLVLALVDGRGYLSIDGSAAAPIAGLDALQDARLSADGRRLAWVRGGDLHVADLVDGELAAEQRLSHDAEDGVTNGLADYVAAEELDRAQGAWWNADASAIAFAHVDERGIPTFHLQHLAEDAAHLEPHRYPFAGGPNPRSELRVARLGSPPRAVDLGMAPDDYLARVVPDRRDGWLVAVLPRDQRSLRWLRVTAGGEATELWIETADPWINLDHHTRVLDDGRILRTTERTGFRHLELRTPDGAFERSLTDGAWVVTNVVGIDEGRGEVLVVGTADGVLERHLYAVPLDAPAPLERPERLTIDDGWHEIVATGAADRWVDRWSTVDCAPRVAVVDRSGDRHVIHDGGATATSFGLGVPSFATVRAADGATALNVAIYAPPGADASGEPPPCVLWVYGGPHSQKVMNSWDLTAVLWRQLLAQRGAIVVVVDNRGTFNRGLAFEAPLAGRLGDVELDDQLAAIDELAGRGLLDRDRVAITGGSYGGFMTIRALLRHPDRFRAGVAWAPVVDWEGYDTAYTERYLRRPTTNADGYRDSGLRPLAGELRAPLLIQHGVIDENVHIRHTMRLLAAFTEAGVSCDLQLFPSSRHLARGRATLIARDRRATAFLAAALGLPTDAEEEATGVPGGQAAAS